MKQKFGGCRHCPAAQIQWQSIRMKLVFIKYIFLVQKNGNLFRPCIFTGGLQGICFFYKHHHLNFILLCGTGTAAPSRGHLVLWHLKSIKRRFFSGFKKLTISILLLIRIITIIITKGPTTAQTWNSQEKCDFNSEMEWWPLKPKPAQDEDPEFTHSQLSEECDQRETRLFWLCFGNLACYDSESYSHRHFLLSL